MRGSVLPKYFAPHDDVRLVLIDECLEFCFFSWALYAITIQRYMYDLQLPPLLFGRTSNWVDMWSLMHN